MGFIFAAFLAGQTQNIIHVHAENIIAIRRVLQLSNAGILAYFYSKNIMQILLLMILLQLFFF